MEVALLPLRPLDGPMVDFRPSIDFRPPANEVGGGFRLFVEPFCLGVGRGEKSLAPSGWDDNRRIGWADHKRNETIGSRMAAYESTRHYSKMAPFPRMPDRPLRRPVVDPQPALHPESPMRQAWPRPFLLVLHLFAPFPLEWFPIAQ